VGSLPPQTPPAQERGPTFQERDPMTLTTAHIQPIVALIAGVLILVAPALLNYIVAIFLIISGIIGLGIIH
jgi:hypothetical protein